MRAARVDTGCHDNDASETTVVVSAETDSGSGTAKTLLEVADRRVLVDPDVVRSVGCVTDELERLLETPGRQLVDGHCFATSCQCQT